MKFITSKHSTSKKPLSNAFIDDWQWNRDDRSDAVFILLVVLKKFYFNFSFFF